MCTRATKYIHILHSFTAQYTPTRGHTWRTRPANQRWIRFFSAFCIKTCIQWLESLHFTSNSRRDHILTFTLVYHTKSKTFSSTRSSTITTKYLVLFSSKTLIYFSFAINSVPFFWAKKVNKKLCVKITETVANEICA